MPRILQPMHQDSVRGEPLPLLLYLSRRLSLQILAACFVHQVTLSAIILFNNLTASITVLFNTLIPHALDGKRHRHVLEASWTTPNSCQSTSAWTVCSSRYIECHQSFLCLISTVGNPTCILLCCLPTLRPLVMRQQCVLDNLVSRLIGPFLSLDAVYV